MKTQYLHLHHHNILIDTTVYQCPMKCEGDKTYYKPGYCPVCNMYLKPIDSTEKFGAGRESGSL